MVCLLMVVLFGSFGSWLGALVVVWVGVGSVRWFGFVYSVWLLALLLYGCLTIWLAACLRDVWVVGW